MATTGALLFVTDLRRFLSHLAQPNRQSFHRGAQQHQKYVVSTTLKEPLPWINSTLLKGDAAEAVTRLKEQPGRIS